MAAKNKPFQKLTPAALGIDAGALAQREKITKVYPPVKNLRTEFLEGSAKEIAAKLVDKLKNEARVL